MELFDLSGRVAVVTGGNGGIGLGMARGMARAGARHRRGGPRRRQERRGGQASSRRSAPRRARIPVDVLKEDVLPRPGRRHA